MKRTLSQTYIFAGKFYGPGEVDLPDDVDAALKARGAFGNDAAPEGEAHPGPEGESDQPDADKPSNRRRG